MIYLKMPHFTLQSGSWQEMVKPISGSEIEKETGEEWSEQDGEDSKSVERERFVKYYQKNVNVYSKPFIVEFKKTCF